MNIKLEIQGIKLEDNKCCLCGKSFDLTEGDLFIVSVDLGRRGSRLDPEIDPEINIRCLKCQ